MAKLIYSAITSLDGYVADEHGNFDWAAPDEEVHAFVNDLERPVGTHLLGRRMYEVLVAWETPETFTDGEPVLEEYAEIWQAADKVVYSRTLEAVSSARTRIEREFDPEAVRRMKAQAERDIGVGGPGLAAEAIRSGLVDEYHLIVSPVVVGSGIRPFPTRSTWTSNCWTPAASATAWSTSTTEPEHDAVAPVRTSSPWVGSRHRTSPWPTGRFLSGDASSERRRSRRASLGPARPPPPRHRRRGLLVP